MVRCRAVCGRHALFSGWAFIASAKKQSSNLPSIDLAQQLDNTFARCRGPERQRFEPVNTESHPGGAGGDFWRRLRHGNVANRMSEAGKAPAAVPAIAAHTGTHSGQSPLSLEQLRKVELMGRVQKDLDLTPEQHARIEKIIEDSQERIRDLWEQVALTFTTAIRN